MATDKQSFVLYCDIIHTVKQLSNEKAGELFKHVLSYVNDEEPKTDDMILKIAFEPIKQSLKRDLRKYEKRAERSRNNGQLGGRPPKDKTQETQQVISKPKKPDSVIGIDSVIDSAIKNKDVIDWDSLMNKYNKITGKKSRVVNQSARKQIKARLKEGYKRTDIIKAIEACANDEYHIKTNLKHLTLEFISRPDKLDKYLTVKDQETKTVFKKTNNHRHG